MRFLRESFYAAKAFFSQRIPLIFEETKMSLGFPILPGFSEHDDTGITHSVETRYTSLRCLGLTPAVKALL